MARITRIVEPKRDEKRQIVYQTLIKGKRSPKGDKVLERKVVLKYPVNEIAEMLEMQARAEGFEAPLFQVRSGYRSIAEQKKIYAEAVANYRQIIIDEFMADGLTREQAEAAATPNIVEKRTREAVAYPGKSPHHTGAAIDIDLKFPLKYNKKNIQAMEASPQYIYMRDVLAPFHKLTQYEKEPWHWECDDECIQYYLDNNQKAYKNMKEFNNQIFNPIVVREDSDEMLALLADEDIFSETAVFDANTDSKSLSSNTKIGIVFASLFAVGAILYFRREK